MADGSVVQTDTINTYGAGASYAGGVGVVGTNSYKNSSFQATQATAITYALGTAISTSWTMTGSASGSGGTTTQLYWYAGAQTYKTTTSQAGTTPYDSTFTYDSYGTLTGITVGGAKARNVYVTSDLNGQTVDRNEWNSAGYSPHEMWYRFAGKQLGYIGNNGTEDTDYLTSVESRSSSGSGYFRGGAATGASYADFDQAYDPYTSYAQGAGGGSYTARSGDSLASVAAQLWGDASLWYKLAQANGMGADGALVEGQTLTIPAGVSRSSDTSSTFRPYDPSDAVGDISGVNPVPKPKAGNNCGAFGQILLVVVAVAVTIWASPASLGTMSFLQGALAGAAGSLASQTVGLITGIQQKFDFKGLALSALSGGITAGVNGSSLVSGIKSTFLKGVVSGAVSSAITQGIGVATGLQPKFDWAGVAAAGIGGGVTNAIHIGGVSAGVSHAIAGTVGGIANAATRSLVSGTDFGDNIMAALPDIIGQTVGGLIAGAIQGRRPDVAPANANVGPALPASSTASDGGPSNLYWQDGPSGGWVAYLDDPQTVSAWNSTTGRVETTGAGTAPPPATGYFTVWDDASQTSFHVGSEIERDRYETAEANRAFLAQMQADGAPGPWASGYVFADPTAYDLSTTVSVPPPAAEEHWYDGIAERLDSLKGSISNFLTYGPWGGPAQIRTTTTLQPVRENKT